MKWLIEKRWIAGGFGLALLLIGCISFVSYQNAKRLAESTNKLKKTHEVLEVLIDLIATLNDAESGRRGYILLGDSSELQRYKTAIKNIDYKVKKLRVAIVTNSLQQRRLVKLEKLLDQRLELSQKYINSYEKGVPFNEVKLSLGTDNNQNWSSIQEIIDRMQFHEEQELEVWIQESQSSIQSRMIIEILGTLCTFAILFGVYAQLYRQMIKRQQAEILQRKLQQEKELGELKLEFFSMASHEFRTPLSVILGSAQLLEENLHNTVEKQKLKNLYRIQSSARLMTRLLSDILTLARAEAGKLEYKPQLLEIQSFCLNLIEDIQTLTELGISIKFDKQGTATHAWVDEKLLYSILSNLLSNAIKYSPQGKSVHFILKCHPGVLVFCIQDEGIGIPKENQLQMYEPFQRGKNVKGILGTGLGLAVVKKCLDLHQGEIFVESEVGIGTTFTVTIPQKNPYHNNSVR